MSSAFLPIILFSIVLPLVDILTDLRLIVRLYSGHLYCIPCQWKWCYPELESCRKSEDLSTFCQQEENRNVCKLEELPKFATLLLGELTS